jgi:hypothetical protein
VEYWARFLDAQGMPMTLAGCAVRHGSTPPKRYGSRTLAP